MKNILIVMLFLFLGTGVAPAATQDNKVSSSTITFTTTGAVVSFNSSTNFISMTNLSTTTDCYADIKCLDANGRRGYLSRNQNESATMLLPRAGGITPNTVSLYFTTSNLGFISSAGSGSVSYIVTGDKDNL